MKEVRMRVTVLFAVGIVCIIIGTVNSKKDRKELDSND